MSIQINPQSLIAASGLPVQEAGKPVSALMMAPVSLTPLAPPSSGPLEKTALSPDAGSIAAERRLAFFADKQKSLLDRLQQQGAHQAPVAGSLLSAGQRNACIAVLNNIAAAASAAE